MEVEGHCNEDQTVQSTNCVQPEAFIEKAYDFANKAAATGVGQFAIEKIDKLLSALEKTAKWSLPPTENSEKDIQQQELERPLSWIPFLATIVALRAVRIGASFASVIIGNDPVSPSDLVYFFQTRRRKLRAIKYHGLRVIRLKKQDNLDRQRRGVIGKIGSILGSLVCQTKRRSASPATRVIVKTKNSSKKSQKSNRKLLLNSEKSELKKRQLCNDDEDMSFNEKLNKYGAENSSDDDDFVLENTSSSESSTDTSDEVCDIEQKLSDLNRKRMEDEMEKKKQLIENLLHKKKEEIENEIKNKLESKIEEKIEKHTQALKEKFNEKIEEIQGKNDTQSILENPSSVSINPAKLSPKIAQNGNTEENNRDKIDHCQYDTVDYKGNEYYLLDEISLKLKLRGAIRDKNKRCPIKPGSSSEDLFYSPIGSPEVSRNSGNHSPITEFVKTREMVDGVESNVPFIENEIKTELQINLKKANCNKNASNINTYKGIKGRRPHI